MKNKVYVKEVNYKQIPFGFKLLEFLLDIIVYALILMICSSIFKGMYIASFWYALLAALIVSLLNATVKPLLVALTLPITIYTVGLFYPVVNLIVLKLTSLLLGSNFVLEGFLIPLIIVIFISILKIIFEFLIIRPIIERSRL